MSGIVEKVRIQLVDALKLAVNTAINTGTLPQLTVPEL